MTMRLGGFGALALGVAVAVLLGACAKQPKPVAMYGVAPTSAWSAADYGQYTHEMFAKFAPAGQRIDFSAVDYPLLHAAIFYATNAARAAEGVGPFDHSPALEQAATAHSEDMVRHDYFGLESPTPGRKTLEQRLAPLNLSKAALGQTIGIGIMLAYEEGRPVYTPKHNKGDFFSYTLNGPPIPNHTYRSLAEAVVGKWIDDGAQRKQLLTTSTPYLGVGAAYTGEYGKLAMHAFKITLNMASQAGSR